MSAAAFDSETGEVRYLADAAYHAVRELDSRHASQGDWSMSQNLLEVVTPSHDERPHRSYHAASFVLRAPTWDASISRNVTAQTIAEAIQAMAGT